MQLNQKLPKRVLKPVQFGLKSETKSTLPSPAPSIKALFGKKTGAFKPKMIKIDQENSEDSNSFRSVSNSDDETYYVISPQPETNEPRITLKEKVFVENPVGISTKMENQSKIEKITKNPKDIKLARIQKKLRDAMAEL